MGYGKEEIGGRKEGSGQRTAFHFHKTSSIIIADNAKGFPTNFDPTIETQTCKLNLNYLQYNITPIVCQFTPIHMQSLLSDI